MHSFLWLSSFFKKYFGSTSFPSLSLESSVPLNWMISVKYSVKFPFHLKYPVSKKKKNSFLCGYSSISLFTFGTKFLLNSLFFLHDIYILPSTNSHLAFYSSTKLRWLLLKLWNELWVANRMVISVFFFVDLSTAFSIGMLLGTFSSLLFLPW